MLHYDTRGTGPTPVVLLHGFLGSGRNLSSLARRIAVERPDVTVVIPDLPGHGASQPLSPDATLEHMAQDLWQLIDGLSFAQKGKIDIVGHSLGGRVALVAASMRPHQLRRLVLLDIGPTPFKVLRGMMQRIFERLMGAPAQVRSRSEMRSFFLEDGINEPLTDWILTNLVARNEGFTWRIHRAHLAMFHWAEAEVDLWPLVPPLARQLEVLCGGASHFVSPQMQQQLRDAGAWVKEIVGASHFVHIDALQEVVQAIVTPPAR